MSSLESYLDGSNNGSQHLSALTRDEITAPHVNLVPMEFPGDLYTYVGDSVWCRIESEVAELTPDEYKECEWAIEQLVVLKKQIGEAPMKSDIRKSLIDELKKFRETHRELIRLSAIVFWHKISDAKHKRKIVKR